MGTSPICPLWDVVAERKRTDAASAMLEEALESTAGPADDALRTCRLILLHRKAACFKHLPVVDPEPTIAPLGTLVKKSRNSYYHALAKGEHAA